MSVLNNKNYTYTPTTKVKLYNIAKTSNYVKYNDKLNLNQYPLLQIV